MPYCAQCKRSDIAERWEFCPRCGAGLTATTAASHDAAGEVKDVIVDLAVAAAQHFVKGRLQQKFGPFAQILDQAFGAAAASAVSSAEWPEWYAAAVREQQPVLDAAELARIQADEITRSRNATEMARSAIETAKSMTATLGRAWD
jgi:hypothetical protein